MEERIYLISLYDYYGNLLTSKQREYFEDYYFDNLTINEISENDDISKNAISKQLITIKDKLNYYEKNLMLYKKREKIESIITDKDILSKIDKYI